MNTHKIPVSFGPKASVAATLLLLSVTASAAITGETKGPNQSRSAVVSLAGLDLATSGGMAAAQERVHQTARQLCFQLSDAADLSRHANYVRCVDEAVATAMLQISGSIPGRVEQSQGQHVK